MGAAVRLPGPTAPISVHRCRSRINGAGLPSPPALGRLPALITPRRIPSRRFDPFLDLRSGAAYRLTRAASSGAGPPRSYDGPCFNRYPPRRGTGLEPDQLLSLAWCSGAYVARPCSRAGDASPFEIRSRRHRQLTPPGPGGVPPGLQEGDHSEGGVSQAAEGVPVPDARLTVSRHGRRTHSSASPTLSVSRARESRSAWRAATAALYSAWASARALATT